MTPRDHDERWDELALGHVLGGLADTDASVFRGHLAGCDQCRTRVAELRSMASDLAAAEREERATQRLRTQTESRPGPDPPPPDDGDDRLRRRALVAGAVVVVVLAVLSLVTAWALGQHGQLRQAADAHAHTLAVLGSGTSVPARTSGPVTGVVAVADDEAAYSLAGLPMPSPGQRLVVWVERDGEMDHVAVHTPEQLAHEDGRLSATVGAEDASRLVVTIESVLVPGRPMGEPIVEADLNVVRTDA